VEATWATDMDLYPSPSLSPFPICWLIIFVHQTTIGQSFFYSPTDAQLNCLKNNFKIYNKTDIKTAVLMSVLM
jgi:hypothetical protein